MRTAILDVGSNAAHLKVVDLVAGAPIRTIVSVKEPTRLAGAITTGGRISGVGVDRVVASVAATAREAARMGAVELIAFVTSAIRDAANREEILDQVAVDTGVELGFLSGRDEARLTFLAVRAWYGWSVGPIVLADIGGGSMEIATGDGAEADAALSMPLGAGRLTRDHLRGDPPRGKQVERLRAHVAGRLTAYGADRLTDGSSGHHAVATSKIFTQLARLSGGQGADDSRVLERSALRRRIPRLARMTAEERARLKGVSRSRARHILAGAIVADEIMAALGLSRLEICPWALREGIALRRLQRLEVEADRTEDIGHLARPLPACRPRLRSVASTGA
ncbi:Ppx/GppA family phosphatase [Actinoallomurus purpureus]|uniref:Ppx/GppA phosphatase family protein n=1 Tax=Actinoallomurus purpureus TaxID=478114 RepID=UPI0020930E67|nr:Ppx/GppA family phosphatase [Actinoallomurus purpureus]MCO6006123.1 Ppx/GppA family phosphatase [Actinoallomurus purpureus]